MNAPVKEVAKYGHSVTEIEDSPKEITCCLHIYIYDHTAKHKVKVKLSLCFFFNRAPRHEGVWEEWRYRSTHSLISALEGGEWSASHPGRFTSWERAHGTHWTGGWVGPWAVLDAAVKIKIPSPRREPKPRTPIVQLVAQRYTDWAITALTGKSCPCA
jgi:hypothetical protein